MNVQEIITVSELRKNTKLFFDTAKDTPVYIRRGDSVFELRLSGGIEIKPTTVPDLRSGNFTDANGGYTEYIEPMPVINKQIRELVEKMPTPSADPEQPCCKAPSPCKHWSYDGVDEVWKNTLSGRTRSE